MPRLLHTADVHLGARHHDLGTAAVRQRERQFGAFRRAVDLAIEEKIDVVLVAGDLFDSNSQPRRSVERAAGELKRLAEHGIRSVLVPGTHDCYDRSSIYRVFDLALLAGQPAGSDMVTVLTPERPDVVFPGLDLIVFGRVFETKRAPHSPLAGFSSSTETRARWRVGLIHGSLAIAGRVEQDDVLFSEKEVAESGLHYLALGHWHSYRKGRAGTTVWAYAGAPEPVAMDQDGAGHVVVVSLDENHPRGPVVVEARQVGRTRIEKLDVSASELGSQHDLVSLLLERADPDLVLDVRLVGVAPEGLDLHEDEIDRELAPAFLKFRLRNVSVPATPEEPLPPVDTIAGAFIRELQGRIAAAESTGATDLEAEHREALRLGRLLLDDPQRVTLA